MAVNSNNRVAGVSIVAGALRAFIWDGGQIDDLGTLADATSAVPFGMNDADQVFGNSPSGGNQIRAFIWQNGLMTDLNEHVPIDSLTSAGASNIHGQVLANTNTRGYLLSPVGVPLGDLNVDCRVDGQDLLILLTSWGPVSRRAGAGQGSGNPNADLNGDGVVDGADLLILLANWTF
jgi:probable HAF family extracellular repeat protein